MVRQHSNPSSTTGGGGSVFVWVVVRGGHGPSLRVCTLREGRLVAHVRSPVWSLGVRRGGSLQACALRVGRLLNLGVGRKDEVHEARMNGQAAPMLQALREELDLGEEQWAVRAARRSRRRDTLPVGDPKERACHVSARRCATARRAPGFCWQCAAALLRAVSCHVAWCMVLQALSQAGHGTGSGKSRAWRI